MVRGKSTIWQCAHHYPILVDRVEGGMQARCLGCGTGGPARADAPQAMLALRAEARCGQKLGT